MHLFLLPAMYVDPGSGSMMLQLLLGGVSGIYVIFRMFKQKVLGLFGIHPESPQPASEIPAISAKEDQVGRQA
ncbi:MAG: hypothetical protein WAL85_05715 [Candidatus Korobacteraceae bacterium]